MAVAVSENFYLCGNVCVQVSSVYLNRKWSGSLCLGVPYRYMAQPIHCGLRHGLETICLMCRIKRNSTLL